MPLTRLRRLAPIVVKSPHPPQAGRTCNEKRALAEESSSADAPQKKLFIEEGFPFRQEPSGTFFIRRIRRIFTGRYAFAKIGTALE